MKTSGRLLSRLQTGLGALLAGVVLLAIAALVPGCKDNDGGNAKPDDVDYYTCPMHTSVRMAHPHDKCPICGMDVVPVKKKLGTPGTNAAPDPASTIPGKPPAVVPAAAMDVPSAFTVSMPRQQQIGVTYGEVEKRNLKRSIRAVGTVTYDKQKHWDYVARVDGYVKDLFVSSRGTVVDKDAPLLTVYSPDFLATQNELIDLLKLEDKEKARSESAVLGSTRRLIESARSRLRLWNLDSNQIVELERSRKPMEVLPLNSPFRGVVQDIGVDQGRRMMAGDHLVDVADLSTVWVWVQFYEEELSLLKKGLPVTITSSAYPQAVFSGMVGLVDPFVSESLRTVRVRVEVKNPDFQLRPGMYVDAELSVDLGESLAVPYAAVVPTGRRYLAFADKGEGRLEPRYVELGARVGDYYTVVSGLKEHEKVVTSANFLIDAEAKLQGALKSW
ncbi:MAG TPA: efflux RND transporter periplasmic adaptor subunit [Candidatus Limnocylindria bacterium]|nr:efflux RND transporter periplasmic adaptor subunit [Candidatus Limnocylindria bacterium]